MNATVKLDLVYVQEVGNEVYEQLFPRPNSNGEQPLPLPVAVNLRPTDEVSVPVMFVPARIVRLIGGPVPDVRASVVYLTVNDRTFTVNLKFGDEPEVPELDHVSPEESAAVVALLRAVTGVLK